MIEAPPPRSTRQSGALVPVPDLDPMSDRFVSVWRALDDSVLRLVWPFILGAMIAGLAMLVGRSLIVAAVISLVAVGMIGWFGRAVARRLEELDRISD